MNISHDGVTVRFKTEPKELFEAEKSGVKSNTVRILDIDEYRQLRKCNPKKIIIQYQQEIFLRTITNIHVTEGVFGKVIAVISWTNEEHHHTMPNYTSCDPYAHTMSLDQEVPIDTSRTTILVSKGTQALLQSIAHGRTMNMVINELYEAYMFQRAKERGPLHD